MKNIFRKIFSVAGFIIFSYSLFAQQGQSAKTDTNTLAHFLKKGKFDGHIRTFFMGTINEARLSDYYALATGAGIGYYTPEWRGLSAGMSGFFIFNVASSNLNKTDSLTKQKNRYEIGLFDITNPENKFDLDRMEELHLKYRIKNTQVTLGRQFITTPFINKQDGRMRPTVVEGVYLQSKIKNNWMVDAAWLTRMSPRTTVSWYSIGESIGIYSSGVNADGTKPDYAGNTKSKGVAIAGLQYKKKLLHVQLWDTYVDNIMNTVLLQPEIYFAVNKKNKIFAGLQYVYQNSMGNGGNAEISKRYYGEGSHTWVLASRLGYEAPVWKTNLNYLYISNNARFLMPREWGREPFYTFLARERNEGLGGVNAWLINNEYTTKSKQWKLSLGYGQYYLPHPSNYRLNKYGLPSYQQLNLSADYFLKGFLKNMDIQVLLSWKGNLEKDPLVAKNIINRVNMLNSNMVINYHF
jgi:outer membrane porin, OprD family